MKALSGTTLTLGGTRMNNENAYLEIEVKFHLADPAGLADTLAAKGALTHPKVFETNLCFDDSRDSLRHSGRLLRLRKAGDCRLTFKRHAAQDSDEFKMYNELEVRVNDFDRMKAILLALGFHADRIYEKWRQSFEWNGVQLCIDTLPFGHFIEIEGPCGAIRQTADRLGLPWKDRIIGNYLAIFEVLRKALNLPFRDVTFEHFGRYEVDLAPHLKSIRAITT